MPARIDDATRAQIADAIRDAAGGDATTSTRTIAQRFGVSDYTVRKIAKEQQLGDAFSREQTKNATRAREADMAAARAQLAADLLSDAQRLRSRAWSKYRVVVSGPDGADVVTLPLPPAPDTRHLYTALGIALDKHLAVLKHDTSSGTDAARSMLGQLGEALAAFAEQAPYAPPADDHESPLSGDDPDD